MIFMSTMYFVPDPFPRCKTKYPLLDALHLDGLERLGCIDVCYEQSCISNRVTSL